MNENVMEEMDGQMCSSVQVQPLNRKGSQRLVKSYTFFVDIKAFV